MSFAENYFLKHTFLIPQIKEPPMGLLSFIVVIPAYLEENIIDTLEFLRVADSSTEMVEVIIVFNHPETDTEANKKLNKAQYQMINEWSHRKSTTNIKFYPILVENLPKKHAGAGLARKIGMDEALNRFNVLNKPEGLILSLDADTRVGANYFTAIAKAMNLQPDSGGCLIPFCHPTEGDEYGPEVYRAITQYELHMRYYKHILQSTGFPYAYYTVGSCFGVRAEVYARYGGMNRRKAGEDFYFLNKLFPHTAFVDVTDTLVSPSSRPSLRVPFGTGPVIHQLIQNPGIDLLTYNPQAFFELKKLFDEVPAFYCVNYNELNSIFSTLSPAVRSFLKSQDFFNKIDEIAGNTSTNQAFIKRFYLWFDGFKVVKYLNYVHKEFFQKIPVKDAVKIFVEANGNITKDNSEYELLLTLRRIDQII